MRGTKIVSIHYDQKHGTKPLEKLHPGDPVVIKLDGQKGWREKGIVKGEADTPRSYNVETPSGTQRRNRRHLKIMSPTNTHVSDNANVPAETTVKNDMELQQQRRSSRISKKPERLIEVI